MTHQHDGADANDRAQRYEVAAPLPSRDALEECTEGGLGIDEIVGFGQGYGNAHEHIQHCAHTHGCHDGDGHVSPRVLGLCNRITGCLRQLVMPGWSSALMKKR